jgi:hypothetical protein
MIIGKISERDVRCISLLFFSENSTRLKNSLEVVSSDEHIARSTCVVQTEAAV